MIERINIGSIRWNVLAVLTHADGHKLVIPGHNIVTNEGDIYYAQKAVGASPTDDFTAGGLRLGTGTTTPVKTAIDLTTFGADGDIAETSGYPKTADADGDNTGSGTDIVTWLFTYGTGDGNIAGIAEGAVVDNLTTPTAALCHFLFAASFSKTSSDTLKVFVNHQFNGS